MTFFCFLLLIFFQSTFSSKLKASRYNNARNIVPYVSAGKTPLSDISEFYFHESHHPRLNHRSDYIFARWHNVIKWRTVVTIAKHHFARTQTYRCYGKQNDANSSVVREYLIPRCAGHFSARKVGLKIIRSALLFQRRQSRESVSETRAIVRTADNWSTALIAPRQNLLNFVGIIYAKSVFRWEILLPVACAIQLNIAAVGIPVLLQSFLQLRFLHVFARFYSFRQNPARLLINRVDIFPDMIYYLSYKLRTLMPQCHHPYQVELCRVYKLLAFIGYSEYYEWFQITTEYVRLCWYGKTL